MRIPTLIATALIALAAPAPGFAAPTSGAKPDIIFLLADDMGWADPGYHGSKYMTPNLDKLAASGVKLEQHYVTQLCSSTRACLLSGRYSTRFGCVGPQNERVFPFGQTTIASALRSVGYHTALVGKWHLGSLPEWGPLHFGFDEAYGGLAGGTNQYTHIYKDGPYKQHWHRNEVLMNEEGHSTDLIAREAERVIHDQKKDQPLFLYVAFFAVHIPIQEPPERVAAYDGIFEKKHEKLYAADMSHMDEVVGRVVTALEKAGRRDNALIVFSSDNGAPQSWNAVTQYDGGHTPMPTLGSNKPLRGWKGELFEGGLRVPAFANWPGVLKPSVVNKPMHVIDWFPTFAELAGYPVSDDLKLDGRSVWPMLTGDKPDVGERTFYFRKSMTALRQGDWKLIIGDNKKLMLFNLAADPNEEHDLAADNPQIVDRLKKTLDAVKKADGPPVMPKGKDKD